METDASISYVVLNFILNMLMKSDTINSGERRNAFLLF